MEIDAEKFGGLRRKCYLCISVKGKVMNNKTSNPFESMSLDDINKLSVDDFFLKVSQCDEETTKRIILSVFGND